MRVTLTTWLKRLCFALPLLLLLLPSLQARFEWFDMEKLGGYTGTEPAPHPTFSWEALLDNSYQTNLEHYLEDRVGFREGMIRLRNQVAYSLLKVSKANKVLVGDDNVLLDETAIRAYLGQNFVGEKKIQTDVRKFKAVQDTLARRGILLVFAIAPDKANYYAAQQPAYFRRQPRTETNYAAYARQMRASGVNLLDFAQAFDKWRDTASYPLFPRGGIHWSGYGITLAADTLIHYLEQHGKFDLPDITVGHINVTDEPYDTDNDVAKAMNLLWQPPAYRMRYTFIEPHAPKPGQQKPSLLLVGDSFCWSFLGFYPYFQNLFDDKLQFWYYNSQVEWGAPADNPYGHDVHALNRKAEILARKVVLVLFTQHNLVGFDGGFSRDAYNLFNPYTRADSVKITALERQISQKPNLEDYWWKKSAETGLSFEQLVHQQAVARYDSIRL